MLRMLNLRTCDNDDDIGSYDEITRIPVHKNEYDKVEKNSDRKFQRRIFEAALGNKLGQVRETHTKCLVKREGTRQVFEDSSESDYGSSDIDDNLDDDVEDFYFETRQMCMHELPRTIFECSKPVSGKTDVRDIGEAIDRMPCPRDDEMTTQEITGKCCLKCYLKKRVESVKCFNRGQHISLPGHYLTFNIGRELLSLYKHHAIVKEVCKICGHKAELILIHFDRDEKGIGIHESKKTIDLEKDEIYIIEYFRPRYSPDDIINRAESMLSETVQHDCADTNKVKDFEKYCLLTQNCEHFASWCVVGEKGSYQVRSLLASISTILNNCSGVGSRIPQFVRRFLANVSKFKRGLYLSEICIGSTAVLYLFYCCVKTTNYAMEYKKGNLCKTCFKREVIALWTHFGLFVTTSGLSYIIGNYCLPLLGPLACPTGILCFLALVALSIGLQCGLAKLRKALMSPYSCEANPVSRLSDINVGDMISFKCSSITHNGIVVKVRGENNESTVGSIRCVHYGSRNVVGTKEVIEEDLQVDLNKNQIELYDCRHLNRYHPNQVVERVRKRVGERAWRPFSNRSDHLCFWALVNKEIPQVSAITYSNDIGESKSKHKSSLRVGQEDVHLRDEVLTGQVVRYQKNCEKKDKERSEKTIGIVVWLADTGDRQFGMQLVVYQDKVTKRKRYNVDLQTDRLLIKKYQPAHCCSMEERLQRAYQACDGRFKCRGEKHFIETCILKK